MIGLLVLALAVGGLIALAVAGRRERGRRLAAAATVRFEVDGTGIERELADGRHERVEWRDVRSVDVVMLPKGPWGERVRIVLHGEGERGAIVPLDVAEDGGLFGSLGALPGFDHRALADALATPRTGTTEVWNRVG